VVLPSFLGGLRGLGRIEVEPDEPVFHAEWEGRMLGIAQAVNVKFSVDEFRYAMERMPAVAYVSVSYYGRWLSGLERILIEEGVLSGEEIDAQMRQFALHPEMPVPRREEPEVADSLLGSMYEGVSARRELDQPRRFAVGDRVVARGSGTDGHTRLPAYARGRSGVVVRCHDAFVFPDSNARRAGEDPQWLYCVRFEGDELWGDNAEAHAPVLLDAFEPYLEPAD
jgi:nitrile hydratase beta subunit